jgi:hypothetical protein
VAPAHILDAWSALSLCMLAAATIFAAVAHGAMGFGFPLLSTPLVALFTDVRTAVLVTLVPNLLLNLLSIVRGHAWRETLRQHWPVAAYVLAGTIVGSRVLVHAGTGVLRLLLASMIVVYLVQGRRQGTAPAHMTRFARLAPAVYGSLGGFFAGTVNVALPPLLMYFSSLGLAPLALTQALNLSFLVGRLTQAAAVAWAGRWSGELIGLSLPLCLIAVPALQAGYRLQRRIRANTFLRLLRGTLWSMAALLVGQAAHGYLS